MIAEPCPNCGTDVEVSHETHANIVFDVLKCTKCKWEISTPSTYLDGSILLWDC